jgi:hypothetical protein
MTWRWLPGRRSPRSRGQALVEFALVAPIFFLLLFALIEGGRFILVYETLHSATRDGARYAIVNGSNSLMCPTGPMPGGGTSCDLTGERVKQRVREAAFGLLTAQLDVPTPVWVPDNSRGSTVTVRAIYSYTTLLPIVPFPPITIEAESSLVINN